MRVIAGAVSYTHLDVYKRQVFEPHAGIQDVPQKVRVLHAGQTLEASGALGQQLLEDLPHLFLVAGLTAEGRCV